jgi:hypothetical protein
MAHLKYHELRVKAYLANEFPGVFTHNARLVLGDCDTPYQRYLDFYTVIGQTLLAIEVDEKQHRRYQPEDEALRIYEILHNIGLDKKMVFVRFNPDSYKAMGKARRTPFAERLVVLGKTVGDIVARLEDGKEYDDVHTEVKLYFDSDARDPVQLASVQQWLVEQGKE